MPRTTCSMRLRKTIVVFALCIGALLLAPSIHAQVAGGSITGTVRVENGSVVPGVRVSISHTASGMVRTVATDSDGLYNAPDLPPGRYDMNISAPGFVTQELTGITVS